jgi:hypothetical protein
MSSTNSARNGNEKHRRNGGKRRHRFISGRHITHVRRTSKQYSVELARAVVDGRASIGNLSLRQAAALFGLAPSSCLVRP